MKRINKLEQIAFNAHHPKKPVKLWQVIVRGQVLYQSAGKALCIWWCRQYCIRETNIKAIY